MPDLVVPHYPIKDAFKRTWNTRLELMTECSCPCRGRRDDGFTNLGLPTNIFVHAGCGMPTATALQQLAGECDNCERWYVTSEYPDRWLLCSGCR